jgi:Tfp pilus assembly protein PilF
MPSPCHRWACTVAALSLLGATAIDSNQAAQHINQAIALTGSGDFERAEQLLRSALDADLHVPNVHYNLAVNFGAQSPGRVQEAAFHYRKVLDIPGADVNVQASALNNLAALVDFNAPDDATATADVVSLLKECIRIQPNNHGAHVNLAMALTKRETSEEGVESLTLGAETTPTYRELGAVLREVAARKPDLIKRALPVRTACVIRAAIALTST